MQNSFFTNREDLYGELFNVFRQFLIFAKNDFIVTHTYEKKEKIVNKIRINSKEYVFENAPYDSLDKLLVKRIEFRQIKICLYKAFKRHFKRSLPWGALTGVRPTKLAYELLHEQNPGKKFNARLSAATKKLAGGFFVSRKKAALIGQIISNQKDIKLSDPQKVNFYVHIPFCPTRCYYCSFVSVPMQKQKKLVEPYLDALIRDISISCDILKEQGKEVFSVYIGGGTPTVLSDGQFERLLCAIPFKGVEYTCEAGRPDTITKEKAEIMKRHNVTRVSVNPQTLNEKTLELIGRNHTAVQFENAFNLIRSCGFDINTDIIAGLANETVGDFRRTLDKIVSVFSPENITIHTLSLKNGSFAKENDLIKELDAGDVEKMTEYAHKSLKKAGYLPYYLYRQKNMLSNLENSGYSKPGKLCVNNITVMEESLSVMACGAGAINKRVFGSGERIERCAITKDIKQYAEDFDSAIKNKLEFWQGKP